MPCGTSLVFGAAYDCLGTLELIHNKQFAHLSSPGGFQVRDRRVLARALRNRALPVGTLPVGTQRAAMWRMSNTEAVIFMGWNAQGPHKVR
jgi:hypothetical protein